MSVTIQELREHFFNIADWVDPENNCDLVVYGDLKRSVKKIGTGWVPCWQNLDAAAKDGCDLFISHELFYYGNWGAPGISSEDSPWGQKRFEILEKNDMACINLHDTWDNFPEYGIRDSWRSFLGLTNMVDEKPYYNPVSSRFASKNSLTLNKVKVQSLREFATDVSRRCRAFKSFNGITVHGDLDSKVQMVAAGVGCHIPAFEMVKSGADTLIMTFDRALQTTIRIPLSEMGVNILVVEHGIAEMPGMKKMADYLKKAFPGVKTKFYCEEPVEEIIY